MRLFEHWLYVANSTVALFVLGALAAPILAFVGQRDAADTLYAAYHWTCHQWGFRSFFLFGNQAIYSAEELHAAGLNPYSVLGQPPIGWKMAFCERDLAIYLGLLGAGLLYARRRPIRPLGFVAYGVAIAPLAVDGATQLLGWRESTWLLRVLTGALFGAASVWLVYPRLDPLLRRERYAPDNTACAPQPSHG